ncbi:hypothetical protein FQN51_006379 [Onygenales sp. PD_10]|nr:hypothetical protein FQN51_006379 [Onygenales sp. PD_10]
MGPLAINLFGSFKDFEAIYERVAHNITQKILPQTSDCTCTSTYDRDKDQNLPPFVIKFRGHDLLWIHCGGHLPLESIIANSKDAGDPLPPFAIAAYPDRFECYSVGRYVDDYGLVNTPLEPIAGVNGPANIHFAKDERSPEAEQCLIKFTALLHEKIADLKTSSTARVRYAGNPGLIG